MNLYTDFLRVMSRGDTLGANLVRIALAIVFLWIGALKFVPYEADSITPLVAQSPVMSFFYEHPKEYAQHMTKEGQLVPEQRKWQQANNTYGFSRGLGTLEIVIGLLVLSNFASRKLGLLGGLLSFLTPFVTLSFLITTPETWVPALGDAQYGFPFLSEHGRLIIKDTVILAGGIVIMADSAKRLLLERELVTPSAVRLMHAKRSMS
ncbi:reactive chlorine resistance membrane protein RclC [Paraburkholderia rhizosphaerae]|uniref:Putative membrane protein YkgB n=1 Tax=Paraburkholderia rhizosphaerae TaxID=480658 RepID=A0A4V3HF58_9BURK|nr:reactive chlorine resistance membrane protein RclC [Paraburkholderia rhizosphaerae]TDY51481.1 putative membrane protein YkgB [Paraburkholderia rhizosphaerae]